MDVDAMKDSDSDGEDDARPIQASGASRGRGCAGCSTGGGSGCLALGLLVAGVLARRRRLR